MMMIDFWNDDDDKVTIKSMKDGERVKSTRFLGYNNPDSDKRRFVPRPPIEFASLNNCEWQEMKFSQEIE